MKKIFYFLGLLFIIIEFSFSEYTWFSSISNIDLNNYQCDEVIQDKWYYFGENGQYKVYWYEFENKSSNPIYFWQWKTQILNNSSVDLNLNMIDILDWNWNIIWWGADLFVFNYPYLCENNFSIDPLKKVRILTTAEEVGEISCKINNRKYISKFSLWSWWDLGIVSDALPSQFTFNIPTLKISTKGNNFSFRLGILYDFDNNIATIWDNFLKVICYNMDIYYCWDWIVSQEFGEECDPNDPNDDWTCLLNCKKQCIVWENDIDWDCIENSSDQCPEIPENINWKEDFDWCPELPDIDQSSQIDVLNCNMCPCPYADIDSSLWQGDQVKAGLFSPDEKIFYIWSLPKIFDLYP